MEKINESGNKGSQCNYKFDTMLIDNKMYRVPKINFNSKPFLEEVKVSSGQAMVKQSKTGMQKQQTITLTFRDVAENNMAMNQGMQQFGKTAEEGFSIDDLKNARAKFIDAGSKEDEIELVRLNDYLPESLRAQCEDARLLIVRNGVNILLKNKQKTANDMEEEQCGLTPDTQYWDRRQGKLLTKSARANLCFADHGQKPDYENGKGTVIAYSDVPILTHFRTQFKHFVGPKAENLQTEANYYTDISKCGIGYHGDDNSRKVIGIRLGEMIPLHFTWFHKRDSVGQTFKLLLNHGDLYIMSQKAVGTDWKDASKITLRHAAGSDKFLKIHRR